MADKIINTRIMLKIDTLANWQNESAGAGKGANYVLKKGEIGFAQVPASDSAVKTANDTPTVLFKVGDGTHVFKELKWGAAVAADVYAWAKKSSLDFADLGSDFLTALQSYIEQYSDIDTNTQYQLVEGSGDDAGKILFQKKDLTDAGWTTIFSYTKPTLANLGLRHTAEEIDNAVDQPAAGITQTQIDNWNGEVGAKALIEAADLDEVSFSGAEVLSTISQADGKVSVSKRSLTAADIPELPASKITSGTFADERIASAATWNAKQDALSAAQLAAVNSGITEAKVGSYDTHVADGDIHVTAEQKTAWSGKQDALTEAQLAAVNSGATAAKITSYDSHIANTEIHVTAADKTAWNGKQDALTFMTAYDANTNPVATQADIADIAGAMHFRGIVEGADAATALATITDPEAGDIAIYGTTEYVYNGSAWQVLGDEGVYETQTHASQTYVPKTTKVNNHALSGDIDLTAADVGVVVDATNKSVTDGVSTISNIVSDANYVHTDNNYTTEEKTKLAGIEAGAQVNFIKSVDTADFSVDANGKLDLAAGMNLVSDAQITKITNISEGATKVEDSATNGNIKVDNVEVQVYDDSALAARVTAAEGAITTLNADENTTGSVDKKIKDAIDALDLQAELNEKVDKVEGKSLISDSLITKLEGIETGAQVNVLEGVQMNGTDLPITAKKVNIVTNTAYDASTNKVATMSDISTDNLLQGVNEFILNCGTSDVVQG